MLCRLPKRSGSTNTADDWLAELLRTCAARQIMFQPPRYSVAPRLVTDVAILTADQFLDRRNGIVRRHQAARVIAAEHGDIVQMITRGEDLLARDSQLASNLSEGRAFVESCMTESRIDIVPDD